MITKDLGMVTAYAYAVSKGYTGTETQFAELMASYATVAQEAVDAALAAAQSAQNAQNAQTAAEGASDTAQATVSGAIAGIQAEGQTQISAVQSEGTAQVGNVNSAGQTQVGNVNAAGTTQVENVNTAGSTQVSAVQAKGTEVINSIPSDYTELSDDVTGLKSALDDITEVVITSDNLFDGEFDTTGGVNADGTFNTNSSFVRSDYKRFKAGTNRTLYSKSSGNYWFAVYTYKSDKTPIAAVGNNNPIDDTAEYFIVYKQTASTGDYYVGITPFDDDYTYTEESIIKIENKSLTREKLSDTYQTANINALTSSNNLNNFTAPDVVLATPGTVNAPTSDKTYLIVVDVTKWQSGTRLYIKQTAFSPDGSLYIRTGTTMNGVASWESWRSITFSVSQIPNASITRAMLSDFYEGHIPYLDSGDDLNDIKKSSVVMCNAGVTHTPNTTYGWFVKSTAIPWTSAAASRYSLLQIAFNRSDIADIMIRTYDNGLSTFTDWVSLTDYMKLKTNTNGLTGKKIVMMGDSTYAITGGGTGKHIANFLASIGNCTVYDCSFGGTRMSDCRDEQAGGTSSDSYKYFDLPRLVDAIVSTAGDRWDEQESHLSDKAQEFTTNLTTLEAVDFSTIDFLCIAHGANDFTGNVPLGDGTISKTTYTGALAYCVDKLMTKYPNLIIVCDSPRYRAWLGSSPSYTFIDDVFNHENETTHLKTQDYVDALEEESAKLGLPFNNNMNHYGWNKYNRSVYFPASDGAHFNEAGAKYAAKALFANLSMIGKAQSL